MQYQAVNDAYQEALELESQGKLRHPHEISLNMAIGRHVDRLSRQILRNALTHLGINESQSSQIAAINRYLTSPDSDRYGIPDARLGENFYLDSTLAFKNPNTRQIRQWHSIREGHDIIIRAGRLVCHSRAIYQQVSSFPKMTNTMNLRELLDCLSGSLLLCVSSMNPKSMCYGSYEEQKSNVQRYWAAIKLKLKRDTDRIALIEALMDEMFCAFGSGDKDKGVLLAMALYGAQIEKLR